MEEIENNIINKYFIIVLSEEQAEKLAKKLDAVVITKIKKGDSLTNAIKNKIIGEKSAQRI